MKKHLFALLLAGCLLAGLGLPVAAAPTLQNRQAREVLALVNRERYEGRVRQLDWDEDLEAAARLRVREIVKEYNRDHLRPGGAKFYTLSTKVWAENLAYEHGTPAGVMGAWMRSESHRANILYPDYTIFGAACAVSDQGVHYWVQLFGNGKANTSWTGASEYTLDPFRLKGITLKSAEELAEHIPRKQRLGNLVYINGFVNPERVIAELAETEGTVTLGLPEARSISVEAAQALAEADEGGRITLRADTLGRDGRVQGRFYLRPGKLKGQAGSIQLGVWAEGDGVDAWKSLAKERFGVGSRAAYLHLDHPDKLCARTKISARVRLGKLDRDNLLFYRWDSTLPSPVPLDNPRYSVEEDGFLTFYTSYGGEILVTDQALLPPTGGVAA